MEERTSNNRNNSILDEYGNYFAIASAILAVDLAYLFLYAHSIFNIGLMFLFLQFSSNETAFYEFLNKKLHMEPQLTRNICRIFGAIAFISAALVKYYE